MHRQAVAGTQSTWLQPNQRTLRRSFAKQASTLTQQFLRQRMQVRVLWDVCKTLHAKVHKQKATAQGMRTVLGSMPKKCDHGGTKQLKSEVDFLKEAGHTNKRLPSCFQLCLQLMQLHAINIHFSCFNDVPTNLIDIQAGRSGMTENRTQLTLPARSGTVRSR